MINIKKSYKLTIVHNHKLSLSVPPKVEKLFNKFVDIF